MQIAFKDDAEELEIDYSNDPFDIEEDDVKEEMFGKKSGAGTLSEQREQANSQFEKRKVVHKHE